MALFLDASGQLVVASTMPQGGSNVPSVSSQNLQDIAPWFRALDDGTAQWHPANYYNGASETLNAAGVVVTVSAANRASVFTATDGILDAGQSDLVFHADVTNLANPVYVWTQRGLENAPATSTNANYVVTSANFGSAKSAIITCTVNGIYANSITIARLEKSTAQAGATYGATPEQAAAIALAISDSAQAVIDAQSTLIDIGNMFSDNKLTPAEKKRIKVDWEKIKTEKPTILLKAQTYSVATTSYVAAYDALFSYLNADNGRVTTWADYQKPWSVITGSWSDWLSDDPAWTLSITITTDIVGATFRAKFKSYYDEKEKLLKAISDEAGKNADYSKLVGTPKPEIANATIIPDIETARAIAVSARTELAAISSDSIISHSEKRLIRKDWEIALSEHATTSVLATGTTENTNYVASFNALATYLNNGVTYSSGTPSWITNAILAAETSADIPIVGATFRAKFSDFYSAKIALIKKANDIAATLSSWSGTSGKPSNIAGLSGGEAILNSDVTFYSLPDKPQSRGVWSSSPYYYFGDIVMYNGNGYFCISPHWSNGSTYPSYATWYWAQISQKGATQATELSDYNNIANSNVNWDYVRSLYSSNAKPADGATRNVGALADRHTVSTTYIDENSIRATDYSVFSGTYIANHAPGAGSSSYTDLNLYTGMTFLGAITLTPIDGTPVRLVRFIGMIATTDSTPGEVIIRVFRSNGSAYQVITDRPTHLTITASSLVTGEYYTNFCVENTFSIPANTTENLYVYASKYGANSSTTSDTRFINCSLISQVTKR